MLRTTLSCIDSLFGKSLFGQIKKNKNISLSVLVCTLSSLKFVRVLNHEVISTGIGFDLSSLLYYIFFSKSFWGEFLPAAAQFALGFIIVDFLS